MDLSAKVKQLRLLDIREANAADIEAMRVIRNEPDVRKNMYTDHEISREEHARYLDKLRASDDQRLFLVFQDEQLIGGADLQEINTRHRRADWAYALSTSAQGRGTGAALEFKFVDFAFEYAAIDKLNCEVLEYNPNGAALHKKFGFQEEGRRRNHVVRDGRSWDTVLLGITRDEWATAREGLTQRLFKGA